MQDDSILKQVLTAEQLKAVERVYGDIADTDLFVKTVEAHQPTFIVHLGTAAVPTIFAAAAHR